MASRRAAAQNKTDSRIPHTKTTMSNPVSSLQAFVFSQLPDSALGTLIAAALDPNVASDDVWNELMAVVQPRAEGIAKDPAYHTEVPTGYEETESSPELKARVASFARVFALQGDDAQTAANRLAQTFGSDDWLDWAEPHGLVGFLELVKTQTQTNAPLVLLLRQWLVEEYVLRDHAEWGSLPLAEGLRLDVLAELLEGEILENVIRQYHQRNRPRMHSPWDPDVAGVVLAFVEAATLAKAIAPSEAEQSPAPDLNSAPARAQRRL